MTANDTPDPSNTPTPAPDEPFPEPERIGDAPASESAPEPAPPADDVTKDPRYATDRAAKAGLPPDFGPEQRVIFVRQAFLRGHPGTVVTLGLGPLLLIALAFWIVGQHPLAAAGWTALVTIPLAWGGLALAWAYARHSRALEITNKRAVEIRGLFSRTRDEVLHDHIRNVTIHQSFYERIVRIGRVGIASSGQAETEIEMRDLPDPTRIRTTIDLYRPLD